MEETVTHRNGTATIVDTDHKRAILQRSKAADTSKGILQLRLLVQPHIEVDNDSDDSDDDAVTRTSNTSGPFDNQKRLAHTLMNKMIIQLAQRRASGSDVANMSVSDALQLMKFKQVRFAVIGPNSVSLQQQSCEDLNETAAAGIYSIQ
jgi:hypothetical protein